MRRILIVSMVAAVLGTATLHAQGIAGPAPLPPRSVAEAKSPTTARIIGIFPGAGHMYAGETGRGFAYLGGTVGILLVGTLALAANCTYQVATAQEDCDSGLETAVTAAALGFYGWSIYDAGRAAHRTNAKRGLRPSLILAPLRSPRSPTRDGWALKFGMSFPTR
jgi:hypothetical protein